MPAKKTKLKTTKDVFKAISAQLKQSANSPNIYGYKPHDKQLKFHSGTQKKKLFVGGNRCGKTAGGAAEAVFRALGKHPYRPVKPAPTHGRVISVDFTYGIEKITRPMISRWMPKSELLGGSWEKAYDSETLTLTLENDSTIEFMSYEQDVDKFAGTSRDWIWFDEEPPRDIYIENELRLVDTYGDLWLTMTPVDGMTWVYDDLYIAARADPTILVVEVDMADNIYLNHGEADAILAGLTEDERQARIHGKFVQIGGLIYKKFGPQNIIDPIENLESLKGWLHVAGMDHGWNNPTCWLWAAVDPDGRMIVYDEHYESGQIISYHAKAVHIKNKEHGFEPSYNVGDRSILNTDPITGTSVHLEYIEHGIPLILSDNSAGAKEAGILRVAKYIEGINNTPRLFITRNCTSLIWEIQRLRWATWATKKMIHEKNKKEEQHKKNDHACDALRYIVSSRPEVDTGLEIPQLVIPQGLQAADPTDTRDPEFDPEYRRNLFISPEYSEAIDSVVGGEY